MPTFSAKSRERLLTCHPDLQRLMHEVIKHVDCHIACGERSMEDQDKAVRNGFSKTQWPKSPHNKRPSLAVDAVPFPSLWKSAEECIAFAAIVKECAARLGIKIRWGGDWDGDGDRTDQRFHDLPHFELVDP